jgi:ferredoxin
MPYIVKIDRSNCIQTRACTANCPEVFELNSDDGYSQIVEEYRNNGNLGEGIIPDDLVDCVQKAVDGCPMVVISVEKK